MYAYVYTFFHIVHLFSGSEYFFPGITYLSRWISADSSTRKWCAPEWCVVPLHFFLLYEVLTQLTLECRVFSFLEWRFFFFFLEICGFELANLAVSQFFNFMNYFSSLNLRIILHKISSVVASWSHNPKIPGSNLRKTFFFFFEIFVETLFHRISN
jgi:hypothetical protein